MASTVFVGHVIRTEEAEPLREPKYGTSARVLVATVGFGSDRERTEGAARSGRSVKGHN